MDISYLASKTYAPREDWVHKGLYGKLLVIAGNNEYSGSPVFNTVAAFRSGCDMVTVCSPNEVCHTVSFFAPDVIVSPILGDYLSKWDLDEIEKHLKTSSAFVLGSGLGLEEKTKETVRAIIKKSKLPFVLDADGIRAVVEERDILKGKKAVLTPHAGEFFALSNIKVTDDVEERKEAVQRMAKELNVTIALKGHMDVISDGKDVYINETGSVYMTKAGFGDVMTGIVGALLARGLSPFEAGCLGAAISGKAGELGEVVFGEGLMAQDSFSFIPKAIEQLKK